MTIDEILQSTELTPTEKVTALQDKIIKVPAWSGPNGLVNAYDPKLNPQKQG